MMSDLRENPKLHDLAVMAERFATLSKKKERNADLKDLQDEGQALLGNHETSTDLAELAANYVDTRRHRNELARSAREVLGKPLNAMSHGAITGIGCYLAALATAVLAITPWAWSLATNSVGHAANQARFLGLSFRPTTEFNLIIIVMLMSVLGSMAVMIITFANRAGQETLEQGFVWWYLIRPFAAAGVGVLFYMAIIAGFFNQTSARGRSALVLAAAIGGLAGLFTDNVVQKMRALLGLSSFSGLASTAKQDSNTQRGGS
jgi:hypothetical protein